jgi:hypothetical protein
VADIEAAVLEEWARIVHEKVDLKAAELGSGTSAAP